MRSPTTRIIDTRRLEPPEDGVAYHAGEPVYIRTLTWWERLWYWLTPRKPLSKPSWDNPDCTHPWCTCRSSEYECQASSENGYPDKEICIHRMLPDVGYVNRDDKS